MEGRINQERQGGNWLKLRYKKKAGVLSGLFDTR
jgi:hypothetical protein